MWSNFKKLFFVFFLLFNFSIVYSLDVGFSEINYYEEIVDLGIKDYNTLSQTVKIKIYNEYEVYFDDTFLIDQVSYIPFVFDTQVSSDANIIYDFYDDAGILIGSFEKELNLELFEYLPSFYFCLGDNCTIKDIPERYEFYDNDVIFLNSNNNDFIDYNIAIESNNDIQKSLLLFEKNIHFPYELKRNIIAGYDNYLLKIKYKINNRTFQKELYFILNDYNLDEYNTQMKEILDLMYEEEFIAEDNYTENNIKDNDNYVSNNLNNNNSSNFYVIKKSFKSYVAFFIFCICLLIIIYMVFFNKHKNRKREKR